MPVTWCLANPKLGEREVMAALLERDHHLIRAGQVILADKGFAGREFEAFVATARRLPTVLSRHPPGLARRSPCADCHAPREDSRRRPGCSRPDRHHNRADVRQAGAARRGGP
ncbi:hypothetical protein GCM10027074_29050 [Streptomyces deserti]